MVATRASSLVAADHDAAAVELQHQRQGARLLGPATWSSIRSASTGSIRPSTSTTTRTVAGLARTWVGAAWAPRRPRPATRAAPAVGGDGGHAGRPPRRPGAPSAASLQSRGPPDRAGGRRCAVDPEQFFAASRLVIVAGKGGVGKTTVSADAGPGGRPRRFVDPDRRGRGQVGAAGDVRPGRARLRRGGAVGGGGPDGRATCGPARSPPTPPCSSTSATTVCRASPSGWCRPGRSTWWPPPRPASRTSCCSARSSSSSGRARPT